VKPGDLVRFTKEKLEVLNRRYPNKTHNYHGLAIVVEKVKHFPDCWAIKWFGDADRHASVVYEESLEIVYEDR